MNRDVLWLLVVMALCVVLAVWLAGCTQPKAAVDLPAPAVALPQPTIALPAPKAIPVVAPRLVIYPDLPPDALRWKADLRRAAHSEWGLGAPVASMGAQIHQESAWRPAAVSPAGALGMAQFMPQTATWLSGVDATVGPAEPRNPIWAMRALAAYDRLLWDGIRGMADDCSRMAGALSAYNGGNSWVSRDRLLARSRGLRDDIWWGNVEKVNAGRSAANWNENRSYPRRILLTLEPRYEAAGWGAGSCQP